MITKKTVRWRAGHYYCYTLYIITYYKQTSGAFL